MADLDLKDRKILYQLDLNCRQSDTQIGKKVGLSRKVVEYRIKRMEKKGIISFFYTAINTFKLGYDVFRIYINLQFISSNIKREIIQYFIDYKDSWTVISVKGDIDLDVVLWVKDTFEFYRYWEKTLEKFGNYFAKSATSLYIQAVEYKKSYLLNEENTESDGELYKTTCGGKSIKIDKIDYNLLNELVINARMPFIELAKKLDCSSQTIQYRIKKLIELGIIQAFRVAIDVTKIGLHHYKLEIYLSDHIQRKPIIAYLKPKPYLQCLNVAIGWSDLELELIVENVDKLSRIMDEINSKFSKSIRRQSFWIFEKRHSDRWLPEMTEKDFKKT